METLLLGAVSILFLIFLPESKKNIPVSSADSFAVNKSPIIGAAPSREDQSEIAKSSDEAISSIERRHIFKPQIADASILNQALLENAVDVICIIDDEGRFVSVNPAVERQWGYKAEELIGKPLVDLLCDGTSDC